MTREITFLPDRVYEVTGIWVKDGKMDQLNAYFGKVFPIAVADYGVKPLFSLEPQSAHAGDFVPHLFFVNEWPSLEKFKAFVEDSRARVLFPERDDAVSRMVVSQYKVPAGVTVSLAEGDVVEFAAMWVEAGKGQQLQDYYQKAFPIAQKHGVRAITPLVAVYSYKGDFVPERAALNLWGTLSNFESFAREAKGLFPLRDAALARLEVTHARVHFEGAR